jgi:hypothetical protein
MMIDLPRGIEPGVDGTASAVPRFVVNGRAEALPSSLLNASYRNSEK